MNTHTHIHSSPRKGAAAGFSLVELLVVIAVIGLIAGIAIPSVSKITDKAKQATARTNAQNICSMHSNAREAGASFSASTRGGIVDELVAGVTGTKVKSDFSISAMEAEAKTEALKYCQYNAEDNVMSYYPEGNAPDDVGVNDGWESAWGYAHPSTVAATVGNLNALNDGFEYRVGGPHPNGNTAIDRRPRP